MNRKINFHRPFWSLLKTLPIMGMIVLLPMLASAAVPAPCGLMDVHTVLEPNRVLIDFADSSDNETGFRAERSLDGGLTWSTIREFPANPGTSLLYDLNLTPGQTYHYRVVAFNLDGDSTAVIKKIVMPGVPPSDTTVWHIDANVTGGTATGASWEDAWPSVNGINWSQIKPGDSILISGGTSTQTYDDRFHILVGGAQGNPVTVKVAQTNGRNGVVKFMDGIKIGADWVTLSGARYDGFPTHIAASRVRSILPNLNLEVTAPHDNGITVSSKVGVKIFWVHVHDAGWAKMPTRAYGFHDGITFHGGSTISDNEIGYSWSHRNKSDGVHLATGRCDRYGSLKIHHSIIEENGDDGIEVGASVDVSNSFVGRLNPVYADPQGHPDSFQSGGGYIRFYNNIVVHAHNASFYFSITNRCDSKLLFYGNQLYSEHAKELFGGASIITWRDQNSEPVANWTTLVAANNTFMNYGGDAMHVSIYGGNLGPGLVENLNITNAFWLNNLVWKAGQNSARDSYAGLAVAGPSNELSVNYAVEDFTVDYNIISGWTNSFAYRGVLYKSAHELNMATPFNFNSNATPSFMDEVNYDLRLRPQDTAAKNKGVDLTTLLPAWILADMPDYNVDLDGNPRGHDGAWDIGAFEEMSPVIKPIDRFVDIDVNASGDGKSWATAWKNFSDINWSDVAAGATLWVSGGTYNEKIQPTRGGEESNPIIIKVSQEEGHNDKVVVNGGFNIGQNWITIDGAKNDYYQPYRASTLDNVLAVRDKPQLLTDNIGLHVHGTDVNYNDAIVGGAAYGLVVKWAELTSVDQDQADAVSLSASATNELNGGIDHYEIAYCWIHHTGQDGIHFTLNNNYKHDALLVHHCLIEGTGDDGVETAAGTTLHHSIVRNTAALRGHPDVIAGPAHYWRIYNNIFYDYTGYFYPNQWRPEQSNVHFYGNLIYPEDFNSFVGWGVNYSVAAGYPCGGSECIIDPNYDHGVPGTRDNMIIANNTIIARYWGNCAISDGTTPCGILQPLSLDNRFRDDGALLTFTNHIIKNNILYNGRGLSAELGGWPGSGIEYTEDAVKFDYNVAWSPTQNGNQIRYMKEEYYPDVEAFNAATSYKHNKKTEPIFHDPDNFDYTLAQADTAARDSGENLSYLNLPGLNKDLTGNYRGQQGAWDIGAFEYGSSGYFPPGTTPTPHPGSPLVKTQFLKFKNILNPLRDPPLSILIDLQATPLTLSIHDRKGKLVKTLYNGDHQLGRVNDITWDGRNAQGETVASGVYMLQMKVSGETAVKKIMVVK